MAASSAAASSRTALVVVALLLAATAPDHAQNDVSVSMHAFQDSRGVTVVSPDFAMTKNHSAKTALRVTFGVDAISAASDSCARCHQEGATNARVAGGLSMTRKVSAARWTAGLTVSKELFYTAVTAAVSVARDLNKSNTTLAAGTSYSSNHPVLHPGTTSEQQHEVNGYMNVTQSWTKRTATQFGYQIDQVNGYQANPFLRTSVNGILSVGTTPDARTRHALTARIRQALPLETFLEADYRWYHDTWQVDSDTLSLGVSKHVGDRVVAGASYRRYAQTGAYFYQPQYTGSPEFFTGDFRLFPFDSNTYGGRLEITPKGTFLSMPVGTTITLQYERYLATTGFQAAIFTGGVKIPLH